MQPIDTESNDAVSDQLRPWIDIPSDILRAIAVRFTLIELLSFRGTCREFRSVSGGLSAEIQASLPPWILMFHKNGCSSECIFYDNKKIYKRNIPELEGVFCLASYKGWLLLFKNGTVFFFCPVSLVKIRLPDFPQDRFDGHVASFSDVPTSANCVVTVINRANELSVEVQVISKGEKSWTRHLVRKISGPRTLITAATYDTRKRTFYYMDNARSMLSFSLNDKKWKPYEIVSGTSEDLKPMPYHYFINEFQQKADRLRGLLEVEDGEDIAVCGFTYQNHPDHRLAVYLNEFIDTSPNSTWLRRVVWIQPRFYGADRNHHW